MNPKKLQKKSEKPRLTLIKGSVALTVEGMEHLYNAITGKAFTPEERVQCQERLDALQNNGTGIEKS